MSVTCRNQKSRREKDTTPAAAAGEGGGKPFHRGGCLLPCLRLGAKSNTPGGGKA